MKYMQLIILFLITNIAHGQFYNSQSQYLDRGNQLLNSGFEQSKKSWSNTNGTWTIDSTQKVEGGYSSKIVLSAEALEFCQTYTANALDGKKIINEIEVKTSLSNIRACVYDGSTRVSCSDAHSGNNKWETLQVVLPSAPSSNSIKVCAESRDSAGTSETKTGDVYVDKTSSLIQKLQTIAQAQLWGSCKWAYAANCNWQKASSTSFVDIDTVDSDCSDPTTTGKASAPATKVPQCHFDSWPAGNYLITVNGNHIYNRTASSNSLNPLLRVTDGTNNSTSDASFYSDSTSNVKGTSFQGNNFNINNSSNLTNIDLKLQIRDSLAGTYQLQVDDTNYSFEIAVYYYPPTSQIISETPSEATDGYFGGAVNCDANLGTSADGGTWGDIDDGDCTWTTTSGAPLTQVATRIGGYRYFKAGKYEVTFDFTHIVNTTGSLQQYWRIGYCAGTTTCATTPDGTTAFVWAQEAADGFKQRVLKGHIEIPSDGNYTINLQETTFAATTVTINRARADATDRVIGVRIVPIETISSLKLKSPVYASATRNTSQTLAANGWREIGFNYEYKDTDALFDTATGRWTSNFDGSVRVGWQAYLRTTGTAPTNVQCGVTKNASTSVLYAGAYKSPVTTNTYEPFNGYQVIDVSNGDVLAVACYPTAQNIDVQPISGNNFYTGINIEKL